MDACQLHPTCFVTMEAAEQEGIRIGEEVDSKSIAGLPVAGSSPVPSADRQLSHWLALNRLALYSTGLSFFCRRINCFLKWDFDPPIR